ncbi:MULTISPECIES: hypothetical protein [Fusobacterium]|uniref:hypothetical protein n=1 Tax=Fusobacterium TaxID=848 RepID=UPI000E85A653|nr:MULTISPECIES: hypothetical protein [Fusobacterium]HBJ79214.1 hypothetical protein [Fusobacterium sp.]
MIFYYSNKFCNILLDKNNNIDYKINTIIANFISIDKTWKIIKKLVNENDIFQGMKLSKNKGHQNVLLTGLLENKDSADIIISIDVDL